MPLCENMPSGTATKPGDVVTAMNGKTIQVSGVLKGSWLSGRAFAPCLGGTGFDSRPSQTKDFKLVVESPLSNAQHIKGSPMQ